MRIEKLNENTKKNLLDDLLKRSPNNYGKFEASVQEILNAVKEKGDEAVLDYTEKFDGVRLDAENLLVTEEEIAEAYEQVDDELIAIIRKALVNIRDYHQKQMQYSWFDSKPDGTILGQKVIALQRVGVYVPGGKAAYPSSVLMNIMPAKVAGVDEIIMVTPPGKDGKVTPTTLDQVRSLFLLMRRQIHVSWQQIFCLRQSMTRWHLQFWLQQVWNLQRKYLHRQMHL